MQTVITDVITFALSNFSLTFPVIGLLFVLGELAFGRKPHSGAFIVARHGRPEEGSHSLQMEINRGLYMDMDTLEPTSGFEPLRDDLGRLAQAVVAFAKDRQR